MEQNIKEKLVDVYAKSDSKEVLIDTLTFAFVVIFYLGLFLSMLTLWTILVVKDIVSAVVPAVKSIWAKVLGQKARA